MRALRADARPELAPAAAGPDGALARILAAVATATTDGTSPRLKACRRHACPWAFDDHPKNRSGTRCAMGACGRRTQSRAYRARRRAIPSAG